MGKAGGKEGRQRWGGGGKGRRRQAGEAGAKREGGRQRWGEAKGRRGSRGPMEEGGLSYKTRGQDGGATGTLFTSLGLKVEAYKQTEITTQ